MTDDIRTENDALIEAAMQGCELEPIEIGKLYAHKHANEVTIVDLDGDEYRHRLGRPRRKQGTARFEDIASFTAYHRKHADNESEVYVDVKRQTITAVLDAHEKREPRWGEHRAVLALRTTPAWAAWTSFDRHEFTQLGFAEFVEDHLDDIREPSAADMLEMAQTFQAKTKINFSSSNRLQSGARSLTYEESTDASGGAKGQIPVPDAFTLCVVPLDLPADSGLEVTGYTIKARFRYRLASGKLTVLYLLDDTEPIMRDAVLDVVSVIEAELGIKVMRGTPA